MSAAPELKDLEQELVDDLFGMRFDPLACVLYSFPWAEGELQDAAGPREWQRKVLTELTEHLKDPATRHQVFQKAIASGHGIGKSALVSFIDHWAMSCFDDARIVITANTGDQLTKKTAPEVRTWYRRAINGHWFNVRQETIKVNDSKHSETWRTDFLTWSLERTEAFAGLHNKGKIIVLIFDESSGIPDKIWEVAEGAMTDEETVIVWLAFGNPTRNTGRFRECFGKYKHRWRGEHIDSRTVEGTNKEQLQKWVEDYGEDSDFVRVRVRGEFPRAGSNQFISAEDVAKCRKYKAEGFESLPKILSVDVARYGDDQTVIGMRQGRKVDIFKKLRSLDTVEVAERTIELIKANSPDAVVIDGDGLGAGVVDQLKHRGYDTALFEFHGGGKPSDGHKYFNKRAEVWGLMRDALQAGMQIPDDPELETDLTSPEYGFSSKQQIQLEKKDDMKRRGLASPDCGDMLAMTFAVQIAPKPQPREERERYQGSWMG